MSTSPTMALISRRRSNQSPPRSALQYQARLLDGDSEDLKLDRVPSSCTDGEQIMVASDSQFGTNSFLDIACDSHHYSTDSHPESSLSLGCQPMFPPQCGTNKVKSPVLCGPDHNGSTPVSPISRLTPTSAEAELDDHADEEEGEEEEAMLTAESEESVGACHRPMTAAERRAEKRKAKRFRLTHPQTRFLVREFVLQAHPDAAQRERLSREVPGLSPRQVQVWFQNRRAKLKRLSSDDRERVIKSTALPADFDMTQAMNSPLRGLSQRTTASKFSLVSYSPDYKGAEHHRPSIIQDIMRRRDDNGDIPSTNIDLGCNSMYTTPSSLATLANISSATPLDKSVPFDIQAVSQVRNRSSSTIYQSPFRICAAPSPNSAQRGRAESLASQLRSSMTCSGNSINYDNAPMYTAAESSYSTRNARPGHVLIGDERSQHRLGIVRPCTVDSMPTSYHNVTDDQAFCSAAEVSMDSRSLDIDFPSSLGLHPSFTHHLDRLHLERRHENQDLSSAPLAASEESYLRHISSPYPTAFDPGCSLPRANSAVYPWENPESYGFSRDPETHSLQHPLATFEDIHRGGTFSMPDCDTARPKSFTYGTTYF